MKMNFEQTTFRSFACGATGLLCITQKHYLHAGCRTF